MKATMIFFIAHGADMNSQKKIRDFHGNKCFVYLCLVPVDNRCPVGLDLYPRRPQNRHAKTISSNRPLLLCGLFDRSSNYIDVDV